MTTDLHQQTATALAAVGDELDKYITFPNGECRDAVVLWVAHTHVYQSFESTPRLSLRSTEPGSGKSRVMDVIKHLCPNVMAAVYMTPGVMWRTIDSGSPVLMLDEADTIFGQAGSSSSHQNLRAIINAGHRAGETVPRCVGTQDVKQFNVFCPVAMAGIGRLPETIATRSVEIVMRKRKDGDKPISPFRLKFAADDLELTFKALQQWASRAAKPLSAVMPDLPVTDRKADVWEPLVAIADMASPEWGERARKAAVRLTTEADEKPQTIGTKLLNDIHAVFGLRFKLSIAELLEGLQALPESQWSEATSADVARLLREHYGVRATTVRIDNEPTRGWKRQQFDAAWERYTDHITVATS